MSVTSLYAVLKLAENHMLQQEACFNCIHTFHLLRAGGGKPH
jgi:hypothetical protein